MTKYINILIIIFLPYNIFAQIDTVYNKDGTFEYGIMKDGKRYGTWVNKGTSYYSFTKKYNENRAYVKIFESINTLDSEYAIKVVKGKEIKDGIYKGYFLGKITVEGLYVNGYRYGKWNYYDLHGNIERTEFHYKQEKTFLCIYFYKNKRIKEIGSFKIEKGKTGKWVEFYENGNIKSSGEYSDGYITLPIKHGTAVGSEIIYNKNKDWLYWDKDGGFIKKETYKKGVIKSSKPVAKQKKISEKYKFDD